MPLYCLLYLKALKEKESFIKNKKETLKWASFKRETADQKQTDLINLYIK